MGLVEILILALVQGITEFLPISSDGHLVVTSSLLGKPSLALTIILHAGTLLTILYFYWGRLFKLLGEDRKLLPLIVIGSIPVVLFGVYMEKFHEDFLENSWWTGVFLLVTGCVLLWGQYAPRGSRSYTELTWKEALWIGVWQAAAVLPGWSRSGSTVAAGLRCGLSPQAATDFSFVLGTPAMAGAIGYKLFSMYRNGETAGNWLHLALGAALAFVVGLMALKWLLAWVAKGRLHWFAGWCFVLGILVLCWQSGLFAPLGNRAGP